MTRRTLHFIYTLLLITLCAACDNLLEFSSSGRYVVTAQHLYVRSAPSPTSVVLRTYSHGDTITAKQSDTNWLIVNADGATGFVPSSSIKPLETPSHQGFIIFDNINNWHSWIYWAVLATALVLWWLCERINMQIRKRIGAQGMVRRLPLIPVVLFVCGCLCGVLYHNWHDQLIDSLQSLLSLTPTQSDVMGWLLWAQVLVALITLLIDLLASIFKSGVKGGLLLTLADLLLGLMVFTTALLLTTTFYLVGLAIAIVLFAARYIRMVSRNTQQHPRYVSTV